jgi:hypothetical protein
MQNFQRVFNSVQIMSIVTLTMAMATLMFISFFLASVPSGI